MRKTVFVSSTFRDLAEHRRAVWDLLETLDVNIRGMEAFGARTEGPLETCLAEVEQSDIYIGLIGFRLGSVDAGSGMSFTQREYERARELGREILIYLRDDDATIRRSDIDLDPKPREKLESFKRTLRDNHTVDTFDSPADLITKLRRDLQRYVLPKKEEKAGDEFEQAKVVAQRFFLLPKSLSGSAIRLDLKFKGKPFAASRSLCQAFNLPYGGTIGTPVEIVRPAGEPFGGFKELFAAGKRADELLPHQGAESLGIYARLQFSPDDTPRSRARFFGEYVYMDPEPEDEDPFAEWRPGEGRIILLFSKLAGEDDTQRGVVAS